MLINERRTVQSVCVFLYRQLGKRASFPYLDEFFALNWEYTFRITNVILSCQRHNIGDIKCDWQTDQFIKLINPIPSNKLLKWQSFQLEIYRIWSNFTYESPFGKLGWLPFCSQFVESFVENLGQLSSINANQSAYFD